MGVIIWFYPAPGDLTPQAWHMLAIFAATIAATLTQPPSLGVAMLITLCVVIFTRTLLEAKALSGSVSGTVWLTFYAYVLSLGFVTLGLGERIMYKVLSFFGDNDLGIAYLLGVSGLIMAPAISSVTAWSGGIIFPITHSVSDMLGFAPGVTGKRIGNFLTMVCFQLISTTGAIFLTGMATNPLIASPTKSSSGMETAWGGWFISIVVPAMVCFCLMSLLVYKLLDPELKRTPEAKVTGKQASGKLGSMSSNEKKVVSGFVLALVGRGTSLITRLSATSVELGLAAYLFTSGVVSWKSLLNNHTAWDTVIWLSVIISLATGLTGLSSIKQMTIKLGGGIQGFGAIKPSIVPGILYIYVHYLFATATGHIATLYAPLAATTIAAGAPPMMAAICFGIFDNLMWGNTEHGGGPDPIYFAQDYFERPHFHKVNLCMVTANVIITSAVGMLWWKLLGYY